jgi:hypothetical protein
VCSTKREFSSSLWNVYLVLVMIKLGVGEGRWWCVCGGGGGPVIVGLNNHSLTPLLNKKHQFLLKYACYFLFKDGWKISNQKLITGRLNIKIVYFLKEINWYRWSNVIQWIPEVVLVISLLGNLRTGFVSAPNMTVHYKLPCRSSSGPHTTLH